MKLLVFIALRHLLARRRQSAVSIIGIILGTAFFLAISSLMQGSEADFLNRLVNNSPHITVSDEYRNPRVQPALRLYPKGAIDIRHVVPLSENRGIRGYEQKLKEIRAIPGVKAAANLSGSAIINFAGQDQGITLNGMNPNDVKSVTSIAQYMVKGTIDDLAADPNGIVIGAGLADRLELDVGRTITLSTNAGGRRSFKIVGIFRTGRGSYDIGQTYVDIKRAQAMLNLPNRANSIIIKLDDAQQARDIAAQIETQIGYKAMSWQEASEDIMSTLVIRNVIMYTVVSAVLVVAAFGIYNVISTVVMEKHKDIAILKSMGFEARDIRFVFLVQGVVLGIAGCGAGIPLGCAFMLGLMQVKMRIPGAGEKVSMPLSWDWPQFAIAVAFAMIASTLAAYLPARKGAQLQPISVLRGQM